MINTLLLSLGLSSFAVLVLLPLGYSILLSFFLDEARGKGGKFISEISVIIPAYNEKQLISGKIQNTLEIDFPSDFEIIVVDDGSTDNTAQVVEDSFHDARIRLIKKRRREGKASAIMDAVKAARYDLVLLTDSDAVLEKDSIQQLLEKFTDMVGAVTGRIIVDNQKENFVTRIESSMWEYGNLVCRAESNLNSLPRVFGPLTLIRRGLVDISKDTLLDDMELGLVVRKKGLKSVYAAEARAHIRVPQTLGDQAKLRSRYFKGYMQLINRHRNLMFNPGQGFFGFITLFRHVLFEVFSPLLIAVVTLSFIMLSLIEAPIFIFYLLLMYILMGLSIFFMGFTLFIRRKRLKEALSDSLNMVFFVFSLQFYRVYSFVHRKKPAWDRLESTR